MNLQQLEYLIKISETESFTKAATEMNVTQPALSKAIAKLEEELDVKLFVRDGRNAVFTPYGVRFLTYAKNALGEVEKGIAEINKLKQPKDNILSLSATQCISNHFIPFLISGFMGYYEKPRFEFLNQSAEEIFASIKKEELDFGFFYDRDPGAENGILDQELTCIPVKKEEYVLIVPKNHNLSLKSEVSLAEITSETFIVFSDALVKGHAQENKVLAEYIREENKMYLPAEQNHMVGALVAASVGITIVPISPVINENAVSIVRIKEDIGARNIYMVWKKNRRMNHLGQAFLEYVRTSIG